MQRAMVNNGFRPSYARVLRRHLRAAQAIERAAQAGRELSEARLKAWSRSYERLLRLPVETPAELAAFGRAAEAFLQPTLDAGDLEAATLLRLIQGQRTVLRRAGAA